MATWSNLMTYVRNNYKIDEERADLIRLIFKIDSGRTQIVVLKREQLTGNEEWVQITSPFADAERVNARRVLEEAGKLVCGGAAIIGDTVVIQHAVPLADMNSDEFERPLALVTTTADRLERELLGGDRY